MSDTRRITSSARMTSLSLAFFFLLGSFTSTHAEEKLNLTQSELRQIHTLYKHYQQRQSAGSQGGLQKVAFKPREKSFGTRNLVVTATAYTSHVAQTDSTPNIAAWGDRLKPGMKVIAVSRDLLKVYGLKHRQKVRIKGLQGEYRVLDKMNKRWRKKIDIYMGKDKRKAFKWGRRKVEIEWVPETEL